MNFKIEVTLLNFEPITKELLNIGFVYGSEISPDTIKENLSSVDSKYIFVNDGKIWFHVLEPKEFPEIKLPHIQWLRHNFIPLDVKTGYGFDIIGMFPYNTASIINDSPSLPRQIIEHIEPLIPQMDNKVVIVCRDNINFGTDNFCLWIKDFFVKVGKYNQIKFY